MSTTFNRDHFRYFIDLIRMHRSSHLYWKTYCHQIIPVNMCCAFSTPYIRYSVQTNSWIMDFHRNINSYVFDSACSLMIGNLFSRYVSGELKSNYVTDENVLIRIETTYKYSIFEHLDQMIADKYVISNVVPSCIFPNHITKFICDMYCSTTAWKLYCHIYWDGQKLQRH